MNINFENIDAISTIFIYRLKKLKQKTEKILNNKFDALTNKKISGFVSGNEIKNRIYEKPYDKSIIFDFKTDLNLENILDSDNIKLFNSQTSNTLEYLIDTINSYIKTINDNKLTIYNSYNLTIKDDKDQLIINNLNIKKIIILNLEIKKEFCLIWKLIENLYLSTINNIKNSNTNNQNIKNDDDNISYLIKNNLKQFEDSNIEYNNYINHIYSIIMLLVNIKILINIADTNKYLFSINDIDKMINNFIFIIKNI